MPKKIFLNKIIIWIVLIYTYLLTISRSLTLPNDWAKAQWLISYKFGFMKRALLGSLFLPFASEKNITIIAIFFLTLFLSCLLLLASKLLASPFRTENFLFAILFLSSPYIVMSVHLMGYFDNILLLIAFLSCFFLSLKWKFATIILQILGILAHESYLVMGFPMVVFAAYLLYLEENNFFEASPALPISTDLFLFIKKHFYLLFTPIFVLIVLAIYQAFFLNSANLRQQMLTYLTEIPYIKFKEDIPDSYSTPFAVYLKMQWKSFVPRLLKPFFLLRIAFPLSLFFWASYKTLRAQKLPISLQKTILGLFFFATSAPLILHSIAWDTARIWSYPYILAFCGYLMLNKIRKNHSKSPNSMFFYCLIVCAILINIGTEYALMGEIERFSFANRIVLYSPLLLYLGILLWRNKEMSLND